MQILVERAATGDQAALDALVLRSWRVIYAICLAEVSNVPLAEDLAQDAAIRLCADLPALNDRSKYLPWLRTLTRNVCRGRRRSRIPEQPLEGAVEPEDSRAGTTTAAVDLADVVAQMLARLPARNREALALHYVAEYSEKEIAALLGLAESTVKSRLYEGRQQSKRLLRPVVQGLLSIEEPSDETVARLMASCGSADCRCAWILLERR